MESGGKGPATESQFDQLLTAARGGDAEALGRLLESFRTYLALIADRELGADLQPKVGASDLVQKTFLDAQQAIRQFVGRTPAELHAWLERMLLNNLADCARQFRGAAKRDVDREVSLQPPGSESQSGIDLPGRDPTPSQKAIVKEEEQKLQLALERLPEDYRQVVLLRHQAGRSFEEIGAALNRSAEAVRKLWSRAILQLQKELKRS